MRRTKRSLHVLLLVLTLLLSLVVSSGTASAASDYDNTIHPTGSVVLRNTQLPYFSCPTVDVTTTWLQILHGDAPYGVTVSGAGASTSVLDAAIAGNASWGVSEDYFGDNNSSARIYASTNSSAGANFYTSGGNKYLRVTQSAFYQIYMNNDCTISVANYNGPYTLDVASENTFATSGFQIKPFFVHYAVADPLGGYEGEEIPTNPPPTKYVAMGDSFSSGEGNAPFETGTDEVGVNKCHRSESAYANWLSQNPGLALEDLAFVACSGATITNVLSGGATNGNWNEGPQVDALSPNTKVVTITIGGNDIKFGEFAHECLFGSCATSSDEYIESWNIMTDLTRSDYLPSRLASLFASMSSHLWINPTVKVYVVGYPYVITHDSWEARGPGGYCADFDGDEASAAENIVLKLNNVIRTAVTNFGDSRFEFVDPLETGSRFLGHELCRTGGYFMGVNAGLADVAYVFHPNTSGQLAYADLIESHMS